MKPKRRCIVDSWIDMPATNATDVHGQTQRMSRNSVAVLILVLLSALCLPACSETSARIRQANIFYYTGQYGPAAQELAPLIHKPNKNYVLNNCRYGSCALAAGQLDNAQAAFLRAYRVMDSVNTNTGSRVLGAVVVYEGVKVWKGQPFERAMAHYYLGLIFLIKGEYENARAAFANSLFKLRKYANPNAKLPPGQQYARVDSNFVLGYFGLGVCYMKLGHPKLAAANFERAEQLDPYIAPVVKKMYEPGINGLIFVDFGQGPRRRHAGWYGEQTVFTPTPWQAEPIPPVYAWDNGHPITGIAQSNMVDTLALAQDKRWLTMDTIREAKAVIGTGLMVGGVAAMQNGAYNNNSTEALAGLGAAGLGALFAASSHADTRYWEMLPRTVYVIPVKLPAGNSSIQVSAGGVSCPPFTVNNSDNTLRVFYVRLP